MADAAMGDADDANMHGQGSVATTERDTSSNRTESPPISARSWPPAIDEENWKPLEHSRMAAEDSIITQEFLTLQAIAVTMQDMPEVADSRSTEQSIDPPQPPAKEPMPTPKRSSPAPKQTDLPPSKQQSQQLKQQDPGAAQHQPELAAAKSKSSMWIAQTQSGMRQQAPQHPATAKKASTPVLANQIQPAGYTASKSRMSSSTLAPKEEDTATAKAKPIASPDVPKHNAAAPRSPTEGTGSSPPCKAPPQPPPKARGQAQPQTPPKAKGEAQPQTPPKAKAPVQSHQPSPPSSSTANPASSSEAKAASNAPNQPTIPRLTGWKNKLAFFTKYWLASDWVTTTSAIAQFAADLQRADKGLAATTPKGANPKNRTWQGNAYSLVHHYNQENWSTINDMVYQWRRDSQFNYLLDTATSIGKAHARDRRMPDWWDH